MNNLRLIAISIIISIQKDELHEFFEKSDFQVVTKSNISKFVVIFEGK